MYITADPGPLTACAASGPSRPHTTFALDEDGTLVIDMGACVLADTTLSPATARAMACLARAATPWAMFAHTGGAFTAPDIVLDEKVVAAATALAAHTGKLTLDVVTSDSFSDHMYTVCDVETDEGVQLSGAWVYQLAFKSQTGGTLKALIPRAKEDEMLEAVLVAAAVDRRLRGDFSDEEDGNELWETSPPLASALAASGNRVFAGTLDGVQVTSMLNGVVPTHDPAPQDPHWSAMIASDAPLAPQLWGLLTSSSLDTTAALAIARCMGDKHKTLVFPTPLVAPLPWLTSVPDEVLAALPPRTAVVFVLHAIMAGIHAPVEWVTNGGFASAFEFVRHDYRVHSLATRVISTLFESRAHTVLPVVLAPFLQAVAPVLPELPLILPASAEDITPTGLLATEMALEALDDAECGGCPNADNLRALLTAAEELRRRKFKRAADTPDARAPKKARTE